MNLPKDDHTQWLLSRLRVASEGVSIADLAGIADIALDGLRDRVDKTEHEVVRHSTLAEDPYVGYGFDAPGEEMTRAKKLTDLRNRLDRLRTMVRFTSALEALLSYLDTREFAANVAAFWRTK